MIINRKNDMVVEREIAAFLDENLYSNNDLFKNFVRTDSIEEQVKGSDLLLTTTDGKLNQVIVDEKVAARYANRGLDTFALEISFINRNKEKNIGWFIDETKTTEYYLFGWVIRASIPYIEEKKRFDTNCINRNNINEIDWVLIKKSNIMDFLRERGWSLDKIIKQEEKIRRNGKTQTKDFINDVSFRYSDSYIEKPINILLKKETYLKLSDYNGTIIK